jgi:ATP-binding cassette, subfamily B, bacterial
VSALHTSTPVPDAGVVDDAPAPIPAGEVSRYRPPKAEIDRDRGKTWLRRALPVVMAHRFMFAAALVASFIGLVLQVEIPQLLNDAFTKAIPSEPGVVPPDAVALHVYVAWIVVLGVMGALAGLVSRYAMFRTAYAIEFDLRNLLYEHLSRMSFSFYDRVQSGQLISRANSDIRSVQMYLTFAPMILVQCSIALVAFGFMLSINVLLALVAMATMPLVYLVGLRMRRSIFPVSWLIQSRLADVATLVDENVNGVRVVKSFAAEQQQLNALTRAADRLQWANIKDADIRARWTPLIQNLPQSGLALVLLFGGYMVIHGHFGVGVIVAFNSWLLMMQAPFMMLGMLIMMGQRAAASAGRIYEVLDEQPTVTDRPGAEAMGAVRGDVRFQGVNFAYPGRDDVVVLRDFSLDLAAGETVALVGRTGSGKSTVARLLARFYDANSGTVTIDGSDVRDVTLSSLRSQVGIVLDEPFLFSMSIQDNIAYGRPDATFDEIERAARAAGAHGFIHDLPEGYETVVGERGYTLSGGQRQRIAIARTLLVNPPVLVLDDATSAVDVQVEQQIHQALSQLMAGRTTLVIAHRLSTISLADRVALLDDGRVVAEGTHAELLATVPLYRDVLAHAAEAEGAADDTSLIDGVDTAVGVVDVVDGVGGRP